VEDFFNNLKTVLKRDVEYDVVLYVIDSLDALGDEREMKRIEEKGIESADYQGRKGAVMSQLFRNMAQDIKKSNVLMLIISQIRAKIGVTFGKKTTRSGGHALDFYASQIIWLHEMSELKNADKIVQGIEVRAEVDKNKVAMAHRNAIFTILMGWGIDDVTSMVSYLWDAGAFEKNGAYLVWEGKNLYQSELIKRAEENPAIVTELKEMCQMVWDDMEARAVVKTKPKWGGE
jgi:recombination protein RecA